MHVGRSVTEWMAALNRGEITSEAMVRHCLDRCEQLDGKLHAFVEIYADDALAAARGSDLMIRAGQRVSPLHGIPIAVKDLANIAGRRTSAGCAAWPDTPAQETAVVVANLQRLGMIVLGKTHTVELAFGGWGTNEHLGAPWNPWDLKVHRAPGGSSSGSGVAVAADLVPWAVGTDTGGSVRIPSSFCGLTGLKVTRDRLSRQGFVALSESLDSVGPLAHTALDAATLFYAMGGSMIPPDVLQALRGDPRKGRQPLRGVRLGRLQAEVQGSTPDVQRSFEQSAATLAELGAQVEPVTLPFKLEDLAALNGILMAAESYAAYADLVEDPSSPMGSAVRARILEGRRLTAKDYIETRHRQVALSRDFLQAIAGFDAVLTPTTPMAAPALDTVDEGQTPATFTRSANFLGICALAVPNGRDGHGMPTSLQILCRPNDELLALRIGCAYQAATDWHLAVPDLPVTGAKL